MFPNKSTYARAVARKPRLIVFDLDGTAIRSDIAARMSVALEASIREATDTGLKISIATGRSWEHFTTVVDNVRNGLAPCIISGGSQIVDTVNSSIAWEKQLSEGQLDALNVIANRYSKTLSYNDRLSTLGPVAKIPNAKHVTVAYLLDIESMELEKIHNEVSGISGLHSAITHAWGDTGLFALHITSDTANKGAGLHQLIKIMGIDSDEVIAIGDGLNDIPMFKIAGISFAVEGSVVDGHELTSGLIEPVKDDGLAKFLNSLYY